MKHLIKTTLLLLALLLPTLTHAHDFEVDGIYYNINGTSVTVTFKGTYGNEYNEYSGSVTIPATVTYGGTTYSVTYIGDWAFYRCTSLTTVNIPNSVTTIGNSVFAGCTSLTNITVASDNPKYDSRNNCNAIIETATNSLIAGCKNTTIPNSVTSIGDYAFYDCSSLTTIYIPNSVTSIGSSVFSGCTSLTTVNIPNSVTTIGGWAFFECSSLTSIEIPNSVTSIGTFGFAGCSNLMRINIPSGVTTIEEYALSGCSSLTQIEISNSITSFGSGAFSGSGLTSIEIPNSVKSIGDWAFQSCKGLTNLTIPDSVQSIGNYAFQYCTNLQSVTIGKSVTHIGSEAFFYSGLETVNFNAISCSDFKCDIFSCEGESNISTINIGDCVQVIPGHFAVWLPKLKSIIIPNSVTTIGTWAFMACNNLTNVSFGCSVKTIEDNAFCGTNLTNIIIPNSVTTIGDRAFLCYSLSDIYSYSTTPPVCNDDPFTNYSATLHVPAASLAAYFTAPVWSNFENIVGDAVAPTGITISKDSVEMPINEQIELTATVTPANASCKDVTWYSTDTNVATVDNGTVTAVSIGECDIIAYCMGMTAVCHISVTNRISLGQHEAMLLPNHMLTLTPTAPVMPAGFTVTSSDPAVAAARVMSGKVQIVGIKEGTTTITVASTDGTAQPATCLVTVYTEPGDVNGDGFSTINDATMMIDYLLGGGIDNFKAENADVNMDGQFSISDITDIIDLLLSF